jgi:large conductance mechanosensitive channel
MKIVNEFKEFAIKGNMTDMAVGIIIGGAFGKIVTSLVNDVIMPPIGIMTGGVDFADKVLILKKASETAEAVTLNYGLFMNNVLNFLIVAFAIFIVIKQVNKLRRKEDEAPEEKKVVPIPQDIKLLTEIRDSLKK